MDNVEVTNNRQASHCQADVDQGHTTSEECLGKYLKPRCTVFPFRFSTFETKLCEY